MTSGEHTKEHTELPGKIWAERVGIGADDIALLASSLPIRSTPYYRADSVAELVKALEATQFGFNHRRCPVCAGWNVGPNGETDMVHTKDCIVGTALTRFRELESSAKGGAS